MKTQKLGTNSLLCSRLAYGCWRIAGTWDPSQVTAEAQAGGHSAVIAAFEAGYTLFDHADIYCRGMCEKVFGDVLRQVPCMRQRILIATKCGIRFAGDPEPDAPFRYDFSESHILRSCEQSLQRLGVETIDLYHLHRPDLLMRPEEVASAFEKLKAAGKVRYFGVSNFTPSQVSLLQRACPMPLIVNQVEIHLGRLDCLADGTLDQCKMEKMTPLAWSPLGGGFLGTGATVSKDLPRHGLLVKLQSAADRIAEKYGVSRGTIALAWLLKHPSGIVPIVGSTNPEHIASAVRADEVELSREDWYALLEAARGERLP